MKMDNSYLLLEDLKDGFGFSIHLEARPNEITYLADKQGNQLKLNKGILIHNNKGIGIISNRIIRDNENWLVEEIEQVLLEKLGIALLYFVPVIPEDKSGNLQKYLKFKDEHTLSLKNNADNPKFWERVSNYLKRQGFRVVNNL